MRKRRPSGAWVSQDWPSTSAKARFIRSVPKPERAGGATVGRLVARQQVVGMSQRHHPAFEGLEELGGRQARLRGLSGDRQHRGKQVLQAMLQLAHDQLLLLVRAMAIECKTGKPGADRL